MISNIRILAKYNYFQSEKYAKNVFFNEDTFFGKVAIEIKSTKFRVHFFNPKNNEKINDLFQFGIRYASTDLEHLDEFLNNIKSWKKK